MIPVGFSLSTRPFIGVILVLGTFGTLFLRSFNIFNVGGKNILLAGISISIMILLLCLQAFKGFVSGRLKIGFWFVATLLFFSALVGFGALKFGFGRALADSRYFMWVIWGYLIFESVRANSENVSFQARILRIAGILTIGYSFFSLATGVGAKQLTTGGFRYVEEDSLAYISVVFFFLVSRFLILRKSTPGGLVLLVISLFFILVSAKRAVWGGISLGLLGQLFVTRINPRKILGIGFIGLLAAGAVFKLSASSREILLNRVSVVAKGKITDPSIFFRFAAWKKVIDAGIRNPLVPGGVGSDFDFELNVLGLHQKFKDVSPHNTVMWVFFKTGIFGIFFYFRLVFLTLKRARWLVRRYRDSGDLERQMQTSILFSLFLYGTFASMFWDYFAIASMAIIYWWTIGAINGWYYSVAVDEERATVLTAAPASADGYSAPAPA